MSNSLFHKFPTGKPDLASGDRTKHLRSRVLNASNYQKCRDLSSNSAAAIAMAAAMQRVHGADCSANGIPPTIYCAPGDGSSLTQLSYADRLGMLDARHTIVEKLETVEDLDRQVQRADIRTFETPQCKLQAGEKTSVLRAEAVYDTVVDLANHGGRLLKPNGATYIGAIYIGRNTAAEGSGYNIARAASYRELIDVTKGKRYKHGSCDGVGAGDIRLRTGDIYYGNYLRHNAAANGVQTGVAFLTGGGGVRNQTATFGGTYAGVYDSSGTTHYHVDPSYGLLYDATKTATYYPTGRHYNRTQSNELHYLRHMTVVANAATATNIKKAEAMALDGYSLRGDRVI